MINRWILFFEIYYYNRLNYWVNYVVFQRNVDQLFVDWKETKKHWESRCFLADFVLFLVFWISSSLMRRIPFLHTAHATQVAVHSQNILTFKCVLLLRPHAYRTLLSSISSRKCCIICKSMKSYLIRMSIVFCALNTFLNMRKKRKAREKNVTSSYKVECFLDNFRFSYHKSIHYTATRFHNDVFAVKLLKQQQPIEMNLQWSNNVCFGTAATPLFESANELKKNGKIKWKRKKLEHLIASHKMQSINWLFFETEATFEMSIILKISLCSRWNVHQLIWQKQACERTVHSFSHIL